MRRLFAALVLAVLVGACGAAPGGQGRLPVPSPPTAALVKWKDFPANAHPRPVIAFGDTVEHIQPQGFPNGDRKIAWMCNRFAPAPGVTLSPAAAPGRISAARAYAELMAERSQSAATNSECASLPAFEITAVRLATAGFPTDRGTAQLPAWLFDVPEVGAFIGHLALEPSDLWSGGVITWQGRGAVVSADGRTLKISVTNAIPGPCGYDYTASTAESDTAVAVAVLQIPHAAPSEAAPCRLSLSLSLQISYITVTLRVPLGGRVLVDENGDVGAACPEDGDCSAQAR